MRVPPAPFDDGYDIHAPKATEVEKENARVPPFLCFIDLRHKAVSTAHFVGRCSLALEYHRR